MHSYLKGNPSLLQAVRRLEQLGPDKFELYFMKKSSTKIEAKDQKVDSLSRAEDVGLSIRVLKDHRMGFSFTTSLEESAIERAVRSAIEIAAVMPADEYNDLISLGEYVYPAVDTLDSKGLALPVEQKIELAMSLERTTREADPRITGIRSAAISETDYQMHLVDSNGEHVQHRSSVFSASVSCKSEEDGDSQSGGDFGFSNFYEQLDVKSVGTMAARLTTELLGAKSAPTMRCPTVLRNSVVADLLEFLSSSFSAEEIAKGRSMLAKREGDRIFSEITNVIDDGLLAGGLATSPFDGEGLPSSQTKLVDGGVMCGILCNSYYARKLEREPTGNSSRGIKEPPSISTTNLYMQPGRKTPEQLYDGIERGILITDLMGLHTANSVTGDFSLGASGILIENGKLTRPVRGFAVAGNVLDVFRRITDIGTDLRFFGTTGAPSVRISELSIGGT